MKHFTLLFLFSTLCFHAQAQQTTTEAITETPQGTLYDNMYRFSGAYEAASLGNGRFTISDGVVGSLVVAEDGSFYMKDPFSRFAYGSWIKGQLSNDTVTFQFPQFIYSEVSPPYTLNCHTMRMRVNAKGDAFETDPTSQQMKFLWKNGQLTQLEEDAILGMVAIIPEMNNMQVYVGYADYDIRFLPAPSTAVTPPADLQTETYMLNYWPDDEQEDYRMVQVGIKDGNIYMNNISNSNPQAWISGAYDGNSARFFSGIYLGKSYRLNPYDPDQHIFFMPAREVKQVYQSGSYTSNFYTAAHIDFQLDPETGALCSDSVLTANTGITRIYAETIFRQPSIQPFNETAGTPADPLFIRYVPYDASHGFGFMIINMPKLTTDGNQMNLDKLFYNIYLDDEIMTFYPDEYWYIDEEMNDMPYAHVDKRDFSIDANLHTLFFYQAGFDRIGVQMIYRGGGEEHKSNIVYYTEETNSMALVSNNANNEHASNAIYDMQGRRANNSMLRKGMYIKNGKKFIIK